MKFPNMFWISSYQQYLFEICWIWNILVLVILNTQKKFCFSFIPGQGLKLHFLVWLLQFCPLLRVCVTIVLVWCPGPHCVLHWCHSDNLQSTRNDICILGLIYNIRISNTVDGLPHFRFRHNSFFGQSWFDSQISGHFPLIHSPPMPQSSPVLHDSPKF